MTLVNDELRLGDERNRLEQEADDRAEDVVDSDLALEEMPASFRNQIKSLEERGRGAAYLAAEYGTDATVTVAGLDSGEFALVEDRVNSYRQQAEADSAGGYYRNVYAAAGLVDAPFFDADHRAEIADKYDAMSIEDGEKVPDWHKLPQTTRLDAKIKVVTDLPPAATKWLFNAVDERTTGDEGNWTPFEQRLREKQQD